jgi:hypothetical protein
MSMKTNGTLVLAGVAPDDTTIVDYVRDLRNSGQFSQVLIANMSEVDFNKWTFTLNMK